MLARQIMSHQVITVGVNTAIVDAIKIMLSHHVSGLPMVDPAGKLVGIVSESDLIRRAEIGTERQRERWLTFLAGPDRVAFDFARAHGQRIGQIMTADPITIREDTPLPQIVEIMEKYSVKRLPVMRENKIVGMVTRADFLPAIVNLVRNTEGVPQDDDRIRNAVLLAMARAPWRPYALNVGIHEGIVSLKGSIRSEHARQAAMIAAENVPGVRRVEDRLEKKSCPPPEEDYGGGDFVRFRRSPRRRMISLCEGASPELSIQRV
jgi:CBS domain-containing protein